MVALSAALLLALYPAPPRNSAGWPRQHFALIALAVAGWVGVTLVPVLAKRTPSAGSATRWNFASPGGWVYMAGILLVALPALNTGNNLSS